jgi:hypothetical protein
LCDTDKEQQGEEELDSSAEEDPTDPLRDIDQDHGDEPQGEEELDSSAEEDPTDPLRDTDAQGEELDSSVASEPAGQREAPRLRRLRRIQATAASTPNSDDQLRDTEEEQED